MRRVYREATARQVESGWGIALDGRPVSGFDDIHRVLSEERVGKQLELVLLRRGRRLSATVTPHERS